MSDVAVAIFVAGVLIALGLASISSAIRIFAGSMSGLGQVIGSSILKVGEKSTEKWIRWLAMKEIPR